MLPELNARGVANVAHAFAKARLVGTGPWHNVWTALREVLRRGLGGFKEQELSNTAWAFATTTASNVPSFATLASSVELRINEFTAQTLANTAWAFATAY